MIFSRPNLQVFCGVLAHISRQKEHHKQVILFPSFPSSHFSLLHVFLCKFYQGYYSLNRDMRRKTRGLNMKSSIWKFSSRRLFVEASISRNQERNKMSNRKVIQPIVMEEIFLSNSKLYVHICQRLLREFFIKLSGQVFPNLVRELSPTLSFKI